MEINILNLSSLYAIIDQKEEKIIIKLSNKSHKIFQAHFPGNHILPGFCHIDILTEILGDKIKKINNFKLKAMVSPEDIVAYDIKSIDNKRIINISKNVQPIGKLQYEF